MTAAPFTIELIVVGLITLFILHQYGNWRKQHHIVTIAVFVSWYFSFLIVFVLPLDVSSTLYRQCRASLPKGRRQYIYYSNSSDQINGSSDDPSCEKPWSLLPRQTLPDLWRVVYWTSQLLSWIILPMMQSYSYAGDFTVRGKIKTALYENALWYGSYLVIFGILLIYVIVRPDLDVDGNHLILICITASNTWGLLLLVLLMGYGLVEIPRTAWNRAKVEYCLAHAYFKVSKLSTEREEAEEKLADVLEEVKKASESIRYTHPLRKNLEVIMWKCPESSQTMFSKGTDDFVDYEDEHSSSRSSSMIYTEKTLIKLHRKVIVVMQTSVRTNCQWNMILDKCIKLEDLIRNTGSTDRVYRNSFAKPYTGPFQSIAPTLEWYLKVWFIPYGLRVLGVFLAIMSLALVWSEVTFFIVSKPISLFALLIDFAKKGYMYFYVELISCLTMSYMCVCVYYTVFKMRIFNYYYLAHNHQTDPNSLLFSGILLCRLTYALCLNFLGLIHLDTHVTKNSEDQEASFTAIMGHMDVLSFIANGFNIYYPMTVVLVCLATYFNLGSRCLHCLGFQAFIMEDELSAEYIGEGKDIIKRERRRRELGSNSRKDWSERAKNIRQKFSAGGGTLSSSTNEEVVTSQTRLTSSEPKSVQYTRYDTEQDRIELLEAVDYDENSVLSDFRSSGNSSMARSGRTAPSNIFDDV